MIGLLHHGVGGRFKAGVASGQQELRIGTIVLLGEGFHCGADAAQRDEHEVAYIDIKLAFIPSIEQGILSHEK